MAVKISSQNYQLNTLHNCWYLKIIHLFISYSFIFALFVYVNVLVSVHAHAYSGVHACTLCVYELVSVCGSMCVYTVAHERAQVGEA